MVFSKGIDGYKHTMSRVARRAVIKGYLESSRLECARLGEETICIKWPTSSVFALNLRTESNIGYIDTRFNLIEKTKDSNNMAAISKRWIGAALLSAQYVIKQIIALCYDYGSQELSSMCDDVDQADAPFIQILIIVKCRHICNRTIQ
ncbi:hypothetical protein J6590_018635 [Homalodisca vitripennis]|nr:hypothetical protein J6590_018635 [Homalodisca vitripennis]